MDTNTEVVPTTTGCEQSHDSVRTSTIQLPQGSSHSVGNTESSSWHWTTMQTFHKYYIAVFTLPGKTHNHLLGIGLPGA